MPIRFAHLFLELFIMHASGKQPSPEGMLNAPLDPCCNIHSTFHVVICACPHLLPELKTTKL